MCKPDHAVLQQRDWKADPETRFPASPAMLKTHSLLIVQHRFQFLCVIRKVTCNGEQAS